MWRPLMTLLWWMLHLGLWSWALTLANDSCVSRPRLWAGWVVTQAPVSGRALPGAADSPRLLPGSGSGDSDHSPGAGPSSAPANISGNWCNCPPVPLSLLTPPRLRALTSQLKTPLVLSECEGGSEVNNQDYKVISSNYKWWFIF